MGWLWRRPRSTSEGNRPFMSTDELACGCVTCIVGYTRSNGTLVVSDASLEPCDHHQRIQNGEQP